MLDRAKEFLREHLRGIVIVLLVIQPMMDVLSYAMTQLNMTLLTTLLRFAMLGLVGLLGFLVTDKKPHYFILYGVMAGFWILHVANCFRIGYISFYEDTANYLRILTTPVFMLSFLTFFKARGEDMRGIIARGFAINMGLSCLFTVLPWGLYGLGLGRAIYTYDKLFLGVMGWFAIPNAQSCILVLLTPLTLYYAYKSRKLWLFALAAVVCAVMLFITGTKLTYYSLFLIPAAFTALLVLAPDRARAVGYIAILVVLVTAGFVFRHYAPSVVRDGMSQYSQGLYGSIVEESLAESGADEETLEAIKSGKVEELAGDEETDTAKTLELVRKSLMRVYTNPNGYGPFLEDLNDRFGVYNVMRMYRYSASPAFLSDLRLRRTNYAQLVWDECDLPTKLLGFEYSEMLHNGNIYDMENDFPSIYYNCGWLGLGLYLLIFVYLAFIAVRGLWWEISAVYRRKQGGVPALRVLSAAYTGLVHFLTVETGAVGVTLVLALGAAQISGYVFRRPNVAIYMAAAAAYLCYLAGPQRTDDR